MSHETKLWSGYRLTLIEDVQERQAHWQQTYAGIMQYAPLLDAMKAEPWLFQDCMKDKPTEEMLFEGIARAEIFAHYDTGHVAAISMLNDIDMRRGSCSILGWAHPLWRGSYRGRKLISTWMHEILDYAFAPFGPEGLGLVKINAEVAERNYPAYRAMRAVGFQEIGTSRLAGLFNTTLTDIVLLEKLNPALVRAMQEKDESGRKEEQCTVTAGLHAAGPICGPGTVQGPGKFPGAASLQGSPEPGVHGGADLHATGSDATGGVGGVDAPDVVAIHEPKPNGSRRKARIRE